MTNSEFIVSLMHLRPDSLETMAPYKFITYLLTYSVQARKNCCKSV